jgi:hypothetical protein
LPTIGITGHQTLTAATRVLVREALLAALQDYPQITGISSLADGADQLFAEAVLTSGGDLVAVIPSADYASSFASREARTRFESLRARASSVIELPAREPTEAAFWAAGREVVKRSEILFAVWDGRHASGLGGTADVVSYARALGRDTVVVWPVGARRT